MSLVIVASCNGKRIAVLFDNDVHCHVEGYTRIAAIKDSLENEGIDVLTVSAGDFLSGGPAGNISKGFFIVRYMNTVGYDAVTLGNHEFDYSIERMTKTLSLLNCQTVCCNFMKNGKQIYPGYTILEKDGKRIAFVGIVTPTVLTTSTPSFFRDEDGNIIYDFCTDSLIPVIQRNVDSARSEGADYVIILSHLGDKYNPVLTSRELGRKTEGIDAILDGHEHNTIECDTVRSLSGKSVLLSSTGCYFNNIGILEIDRSGIRTKLIPVSSVNLRDSLVDDISMDIDSVLTFLTHDRTVGKTGCDITYKERNRESALGDLITDAIRTVTGADVAFVNSGLMRSHLKKGEISTKDINSVSPFTNYIHRGTLKGIEILDMLEKASSVAPKQSGGFMQVSGLRYSIDTCTVSSVISDNEGIFVKVNGRRRVHNVEVMKDSNYVPLIPDSTYTIASIDYLLLKNGDGIRFYNLEVDESESYYVSRVIAEYIMQFKDGDLGMRYAAPDGRITYAPIR